jgi:cell division protease FtsH
MDDLAAALGGRTAEEIVFRDTTTGAADDLKKATNLARAMVMRYGMSESLGQRTFGEDEEMVFLGRGISDQRNYSEKAARQIDEEIKRIISTAHAKAREVLSTSRAALDAIANRLMVAESIEGEELAKLAQTPEMLPIPVFVNTPVPIG